jgi:hypothetical protein
LFGIPLTNQASTKNFPITENSEISLSFSVADPGGALGARAPPLTPVFEAPDFYSTRDTKRAFRFERNKTLSFNFEPKKVRIVSIFGKKTPNFLQNTKNVAFLLQQTLFLGHPCWMFPSTRIIYEALINYLSLQQIN